MAQVTEFIKFHLLKTNCCGALLCWVNPRFPNFCPECGSRCFPEIRSCVIIEDENAVLKIDKTAYEVFVPNNG